MSQLFIQGKKYKLSGSGVSSSATSIGLTSFQTPNGTEILTANLGTTAYGTFEPGTEREEIVSFTTVTQSSSDDTATLSGATRGLGFVSPYTTVTANKKGHAGGTIFVLSNNPQLYDDLMSSKGVEAISAKHTYSVVPASTATAVAGDDLVNLTKLNAAALGSATIDQVIIAGTAGATVAAGEVVYQDPSDQEWKLADASSAATADNVLLGIAQGAGTNGNTISGGVLLSGLDTSVSGLTAGKVFLSDTAGEFSASAGTVEVSLGIAESATSVVFSPRYDQQLTEDQQDAMAGTSGTPASGNLFATELGNQRGVETYAVDSVGTDSYAITPDPAIAGYVAGMAFKVKFGTANTGAATIDVSAKGAKAITKNGAVALETGDILVNQVSVLVYDGTQFQLQAVADKISVASVTALTDGSDATDEHVHTIPMGTFSTFFETDGRFTSVDTASGEVSTFDAQGLTVAVNGASEAVAVTSEPQDITAIFDMSIVASCVAQYQTAAGANKRGEIWFGVFDNSAFGTNSAAQNLTETARHIGFKVEWINDSTVSIFASNADGSTQTLSAAISGITLTNDIFLAFRKTATEIEFYINGTKEKTHTATIPSGGVGELLRVSAHSTAAGSVALQAQFAAASIQVL